MEVLELKFKDNLRVLRKERGLTQSDLAKRLAISRSAVNSWEMSLTAPSLANVLEMTEIFHVSADYLLGLTDRILVDISALTAAEKECILKTVACFEARQEIDRA